jgi:hypothetical protein
VTFTDCKGGPLFRLEQGRNSSAAAFARLNGAERLLRRAFADH